VFDHVTIRVSDRRDSEDFYMLVLGALGLDPSHRGDDFVEWEDFSIAAATDVDDVTRRLHVGFVAPSRAEVDRFWETGTAAGFRDDGEPGPRPRYGDDYYGAFLLDPDGNSAEAVRHGAMRRGGVIDHLWIRVTDVSASTRFYATAGQHAGFALRAEGAGYARFAGESGSFSLVEGSPTQRLHVAFETEDDSAVESFHRSAVEAGYRSDGEPGERPAYHPGYFAAYLLDPDDNSVELVNHHRR
jgi:catechol 2,3-dioxygenase-like lactoylglutathione lyase family enzyme